MRTGAWTAACLLLTALSRTATAGFPGDLFPLRENRFEIPIRVDEARKSDMKALELYMSTDQGKTWKQAGIAKPDDKAFGFTAETDGEYWFSVAIVDQQNRREPRHPNLGPVGQKILVDTLKPDVKLRTERQGETVSVSWDVREEHLDLASLRLEWRAADGPENWVLVSGASGAAGRTSIRMAEAIIVRAEVKDLAQNTGKGEAKVPAAAGIVTVSGPGSSSPYAPATHSGEPLGGLPALPAAPATAAGQPADKAVRTDVPPAGAVLGQDAAKPAAADAAGWRTSTAPPAAKPPVAGIVEELGLPAAPPAPVVAPPTAPAAAPARTPESIAVSAPTPAAPAPSSAAPPPAPEGFGTAGTPAVAPPAHVQEPLVPAPAANPSQPALQIINTRRVTMEYEVSKVGSSGVGSVDVWLTRDDGMSWKSVKAEHQAAGGDSAPGVMRRTVSVDLAEDGIYGLYLVAKSGAGLGKADPRSGDAPQMRLKLDTKQPDAELFLPMEDAAQKDSLLVGWTAKDENLADNPVTLQWAEKPSGPWEFIGAAQLPNTGARLPKTANSGSYSWRLSGSIPPKVYLRLTVRDAAGNISIAETKETILVDLSKPDVSIRGLVGVRGH